ncbi:LuxR C-terminal-related transcriptional regulator [Paraburkholderia sp.]|uniref:LuxR C-terminal-related transcriptional regulator n=1 Tax=Paraburkholderia sp. TaxID=1926495 RepID=UPI0039E5256B
MLNKAKDIGHLVTAIHAVHAAARYFSSTLTGLGGTVAPAQVFSRAAPELTSREVEVVRLYVGGATINEIAAQLNRTRQTVSAQKGTAMRKR